MREENDSDISWNTNNEQEIVGDLDDDDEVDIFSPPPSSRKQPRKSVASSFRRFAWAAARRSVAPPRALADALAKVPPAAQ